MMAVDSKTNGAGTGPTASSPSIATGTGANPTVPNTALPKRKRSSSLMKNASSLPTVEHSLEEFIAKANQTLVDVSSWEEAKEQDAQRKEQDAQRWKNAETQMRESEAREQSLRRQLDGLQGKLAEAEARAAVAGTQMGSAAHDTTINELRTQIEKAMQRMRSAEERSQELAQEVTRLKSEGSARTPLPIAPGGGIDEDEAAERIRLAEAKAAKALAAARAAQAGLTVSPADLAAIESGLVVVDPPKKSSPVVPIALTFIATIGIAFVVWKFVLNKEAQPQPSAAANPPAQVQPQQPPPAPPAQPSVTPIDDKPTPAVTEEPKKATEKQPTVTPIEPEPAKVEEKAAKTEETPKAEPPKAEVKDEAPAIEEKPAKAVKAAPKAAPKKAAPKATKKETTKKPTVVDPFAETPAPKKEKKPVEKKPAGGIVDPF